MPIELDVQSIQNEEKYTFKDTVGLKIKLDTKIELTDVSSAKIICEKPDESVHYWPAEVDTENNNYICYTTQDGDLDQKGDYKLQAYVEFNDGSHFYGEIAVMTVKEHL